jgi:hypothetical protein
MMKMLFSSSEADLVEEMGRKLLQIGVACEVRYRLEQPGAAHFSGYHELWIKSNDDLHWATTQLAMHCEVARN